MSTDRGMDKEDAVYTNRHTMQYCSAMKEHAILPSAATWMDLEIIMPTEVSQKEKDKHHMLSLICGILKNGTNEFIYGTETDSQTSKTDCGYQRGKAGGGVKEEIGIKKNNKL